MMNEARIHIHVDVLPRAQYALMVYAKVSICLFLESVFSVIKNTGDGYVTKISLIFVFDLNSLGSTI